MDAPLSQFPEGQCSDFDFVKPHQVRWLGHLRGYHFFVPSFEIANCRSAHYSRDSWASCGCRDVTFCPLYLTLAVAGPLSAGRPHLYPLDWPPPPGWWAAEGLQGPTTLCGHSAFFFPVEPSIQLPRQPSLHVLCWHYSCFLVASKMAFLLSVSCSVGLVSFKGKCVTFKCLNLYCACSINFSEGR